MLLNAKGRAVKVQDKFQSQGQREAVLANLRESQPFPTKGHGNWFTIEQRANLRPGR